MRVLVTGAAGGIGSMLSNELNLAGYKLILLDDLSNGYQHNLQRFNLSSYFVQVDITNEYEINSIFQNFKPEIVIHLAAVTSLPACQDEPTKALITNVVGTGVLLECSRKHGVKQFIHASTSAVYENSSSETFDEDEIVQPNLIYPLSKIQSEDLCKSFTNTYGLPVLIFRLFNVFGPWQDYERESPPLLNYLIREYTFNRVPVLHSTGTQRRDYISVDSIISAFLSAIKISKQKPFYSRVLNLCSNSTLSVIEIDQIVRQELSIDYLPKFVPSHQFWKSYTNIHSGTYPIKIATIEKEVDKTSRGSFSQAKHVLNWEPQDSVTAIQNYTRLASTWLKTN
jgi:UDP-glucose 4-epimerase